MEAGRAPATHRGKPVLEAHHHPPRGPCASRSSRPQRCGFPTIPGEGGLGFDPGDHGSGSAGAVSASTATDVTRPRCCPSAHRIGRRTGPGIDTTDGWAGVLQAHRAELVRAAELRLRRGADAEDVLHEVLLRLLRSGREVPTVGAPVAYLRRAVANECTSAQRRSGRDVLVAAMPDQPSDGMADVCVDRLWLHRALVTLSERQRLVIMLTILDDRADREVALLLGVRTVTVRT